MKLLHAAASKNRNHILHYNDKKQKDTVLFLMNQIELCKLTTVGQYL